MKWVGEKIKCPGLRWSFCSKIMKWMLSLMQSPLHVSFFPLQSSYPYPYEYCLLHLPGYNPEIFRRNQLKLNYLSEEETFCLLIRQTKWTLRVFSCTVRMGNSRVIEILCTTVSSLASSMNNQWDYNHQCGLQSEITWLFQNQEISQSVEKRRQKTGHVACWLYQKESHEQVRNHGT